MTVMSDALNIAGITRESFESDTDFELAKEFEFINQNVDDESNMLFKGSFNISTSSFSKIKLQELFNRKETICGLDREKVLKSYGLVEFVGIKILANTDAGLDLIKGRLKIPNIIYSVDETLNNPYTIVFLCKRQDNDSKPFSYPILPSVFGLSELLDKDVIKVVTKLYEIGYLLILKEKQFVITKIKQSELAKHYLSSVSIHSEFLKKIRSVLR